ncbi:NAD(FAD)-utilizing dehydrogenase [Exiguobacterium acetylicum]|uniref:NAD(P)/FAD-dependent oxidoreductase n=1 Tax=Exiguobacterium acetylicum TaxID=41170 RepID=UPI0027E0512F|nr:NAD(FAD)-utilizing dehydrogenase [Exiguobacterium acetylicum]MDQ6468471.1 NAD(FAD)-utilizing dehydrogenase [Exiguobacterium acetylicum]
MYDVTIIGAGVAGIFLAHQLVEDGQCVLLLDAGKPIRKRTVEDAYLGFAGLGKSEGKFNYAMGFGGELVSKIGEETTRRLFQEVDNLLCTYGADMIETYSTHSPAVAIRARRAGLHTVETTVRHLGTARTVGVFTAFEDALLPRLDARFETTIEQITKSEAFTIKTADETFVSRRIVFATGRSGADFTLQQLATLGVIPQRTRLDLGVRVETDEALFRTLLQETFETKLGYDSPYGKAVTYCMNPRGRIIRKYQEGLVMPDGQNVHETADGSTNLNFTLFLPRYFSTLAQANAYATRVIGGINQGQDRIVVQRLSDFRKSRATTTDQLLHNGIIPSLAASPGDLHAEVPVEDLLVLEGFFKRLERLLETELPADTLLYGLDGKFYAPMLETSETFETTCSGVYAIGDCSGATHSLAQAAASGLHLGHALTQTSRSLFV